MYIPQMMASERQDAHLHCSRIKALRQHALQAKDALPSLP
jgi:hypothetical protein